MASEGQNVVCVKIQVTGIDWGVISGHTHIPEDTLQDVTPLKFGMGHLRSTHIPEALVFQSFLASPALYKFPGCGYSSHFSVYLSVLSGPMESCQAHSLGPSKAELMYAPRPLLRQLIWKLESNLPIQGLISQMPGCLSLLSIS